MIITLKAVPCVLKDLQTDPKILVFQHPPPTLDFQIPKGTVEPRESIQDAVLRELQEESGISSAQIVEKIGLYELFIQAGTYGFIKTEHQLWHIYHLQVDHFLPDTWTHIVTGEGDDAGMRFEYFWQPLYDIQFENFQNNYLDVIDIVRNYIQSSRSVLYPF